MPFIRITTTKTLTLQQEVALKETVGKLITILPNKTEDYLMVHIEDNQVMYFKGKELECLRITAQIYGHAQDSYKKEFIETLMKEVEKITGIPVAQQYATFEEFDHWGLNGNYI